MATPGSSFTPTPLGHEDNLKGSDACYVESSNVLPLVWELGEGSSSSGVVLITGPWLKISRSVAKSPRVDEQGDVNIHSGSFRALVAEIYGPPFH
ncbi:hypothetical protein TNCV_3448911 [Trichonephila clavipes]|nr:hypothetical protein TNCV_3448911 [Trichonephila clavipes]